MYLAHEPVFFDGLPSLLRVAVTTVSLYVFVLILIRISGKRVTSKMNNFDWIVTVAAGSITASTIILKSVVVLDALVAISLLFGIQFLVTWASVRSVRVENIVKASPSLLVHDGQFCHDAMRSQRVSEAEVLAAVREAGLPSIGQTAAVILENDAVMSVIPASAVDGTLCEVAGVEGAEQLDDGI